MSRLLRILGLVSIAAVLVSTTTTTTASADNIVDTSTPPFIQQRNSDHNAWKSENGAGPELEVCSAEEGCPQSAMVWASGSLTEANMLSESTFQVGRNLSLHFHLCCDYRFKAKLLVDREMYYKFLKEMLHVSPLEHLSVEQQEAIFPFDALVLTNSHTRAVYSRSDIIAAHEKRAGEEEDASSDAAENGGDVANRHRNSAVEVVYPEDGDILTFQVRPQGSDFSLLVEDLRRAASKHTRVVDSNIPVEQTELAITPSLQAFSPTDNDDVVTDAHRQRLGIPTRSQQHVLSREYTGATMAPPSPIAGSLLMEVQFFVGNFALKCKCPHTLNVLPLLRFEIDSLPPLSLEGLGARCITGPATTTTPVGRWAKLAAMQPGNMPQVDISDIRADNGEVVANTHFSVGPGPLPAFTSLNWTLYEVGPQLDMVLQERFRSFYNYQINDDDDDDNNATLSSHIASKSLLSAIQKMNLRLQLPTSNASKFLAAIEEEVCGTNNKELHGMMRIINTSSHFTNTISGDAADHRSGSFPVVPNRKYIITVNVTKGQSYQVLRGMYVLRLPAWMMFPAAFIHSENGTHIIRNQSIALLGKRARLGFSQFPAALNDNGMQKSLETLYNRIWTPMVNIKRHHDHVATCLKIFNEHAHNYRMATKNAIHTAAIHSESSSSNNNDEAPLADSVYVGSSNKDTMREADRSAMESTLMEAVDARYQATIATSSIICNDTFAVFEKQRAAGKDAHITPALLSHPSLAHNHQCVSGSTSCHAGLPQHAYLPPNNKLFTYDPSEYTDNILLQELNIVAHLLDRQHLDFEVGSTDVGTWLVDEDGVCNATLVEVSTVHSLQATIVRPPISPYTICTTDVTLEALNVTSAIQRLLEVQPTLTVSEGWGCFNETSIRLEGGESSMSSAQALVREQHYSHEIAVFNKSALTTNTTLSPQMTAVCYWSLVIGNVPTSPPRTLLVDPLQSTTVTTKSFWAGGYTSLSLDSVAVIRCRASDIPSEIHVQFHTKSRTSSIFGLPPGGTWTVKEPLSMNVTDPQSPILHVGDLLSSPQWEALRTKVSAKSTGTDGTVMIPLPRGTLKYTIPVDDKGLCPAVTVEVLITLVQSPPEEVIPDVEEVFTSEDCIIVEAPSRVYKNDESTTWAPVTMQHNTAHFYLDANEATLLASIAASSEGNALLKALRIGPYAFPSDTPTSSNNWLGFIANTNSMPRELSEAQLSRRLQEAFSRDPVEPDYTAAAKLLVKLQDRRREELRCKSNLVITSHDTKTDALRIKPHHAVTRISLHHPFLRVCGIQEGTTCGVAWGARNAAGAVRKTTVIHRCQLPPEMYLFDRFPSTAQKVDQYAYVSKDLVVAAHIKDQIPLLPVAGSQLAFHYRLANSALRLPAAKYVGTLAEALSYGTLAERADALKALQGAFDVTLELQSQMDFPNVANVTPVTAIPPFQVRESTWLIKGVAPKGINPALGVRSERIASYMASSSSQVDMLRLNANDVLRYGRPNRAHTYAEVDIKEGRVILKELGNSTLSTFQAIIAGTVVADEGSSTRIAAVFQERKMCVQRRKSISFFSLHAESVLFLDRHVSTQPVAVDSDVDPERTVLHQATVAVNLFGSPTQQKNTLKKYESRTRYETVLEICAPQYRFLVQPHMHDVLGYDFTWRCERSSELTVEKLSPVETIIRAMKGASSELCTLTVSNLFTETVDVAIARVKIVQPAVKNTHNMYLLSDVRSIIGAHTPANLQRHIASTHVAVTTPVDAGEEGGVKKVVNRTVLQVVGNSAELVIHSDHVQPFRGRWYIKAVRQWAPRSSPYSTAPDRARAADINASVHINEVQHSSLICTGGCAVALISNLPTSGLYTVVYQDQDPLHGDICPPYQLETHLEVLLAEAYHTEYITCQNHLTISAKPLKQAFKRNKYFGQWSIVSFHTSPTDSHPNPTSVLFFDDVRSSNATIRGLDFGVVRVRWGIYRNFTNADGVKVEMQLMHAVDVKILVLSDNLVSNRLVTFRDSSFILTTSSTVGWEVEAMHSYRGSIPTLVHLAGEHLNDHNVTTGRLVVHNIPLHTTQLSYVSIPSRRTQFYAALARLQCPVNEPRVAFEVERVATAISAETTMHTECDIYNGHAQIILRLDSGRNIYTDMGEASDIQFIHEDLIQDLVFEGTKYIDDYFKDCHVPWWARRETAIWNNITRHDDGRALKISVTSTRYHSLEEVEGTPIFTSWGEGCHASRAFLTSKIIDGVPHDRATSLYVPIREQGSQYDNFRPATVHPIKGRMATRVIGEEALTIGNGTVDISLHMTNFRYADTNVSILRRCLSGQMTVDDFAGPWRYDERTTLEGRAAWERYLDATANLPCRCDPLVILPRKSSEYAITLTSLEEQLHILLNSTESAASLTKDGIDISGLDRATQLALIRRRVTHAQLNEILLRNRRREEERVLRQAPRVGRKNITETDTEYFDRIMSMAASIFGEELNVPVIRVHLPAYLPFYTTDDIHLHLAVDKSIICGTKKAGEKVTVIEGHEHLQQQQPQRQVHNEVARYTSLGTVTIEDEHIRSVASPAVMSQCQMESNMPVFEFGVVNGAFRSDANLVNCPMELIDDGVQYPEEIDDFFNHNRKAGKRSPPVNRPNRYPSISSWKMNNAVSAGTTSTGLHACFRRLLEHNALQLDPSSQKRATLTLSSCPELTMLTSNEYNTNEPISRSQVFNERMLRPHKLRVVLHNCLVPDKFSYAARQRNEYVDATFNILVRPTNAFLRVLSYPIESAAPVARIQPATIPKRNSQAAQDDRLRVEMDSLVVCEWDIKTFGVELGVLLSGDRWHANVGKKTQHGQGSHNAAMLNAFSVVEKEEYAYSQESDSERRLRITRMVSRRYGANEDSHLTQYKEVGHASSGGYHSRAIKSSKFLHYMYTEHIAEARRLQGKSIRSARHASEDVTPKELVRRFNESFVSVSLPPSSVSHIQAPHRSTYAHINTQAYVSSGTTVSESVFADEAMWGFGGSIEEIRMAIPGVTTECNACLLTDVNFFVAGDFAGSLQPYSQRRAPLLKMAEQAQLGDMRIEISLDILARKEPMALFHHWLCPVAAALHLQRLYQISRELERHVHNSAAGKADEFVAYAAKDAGLLVSQGSTVDTVRSQMRSLISDSDSFDGPDVAPSMMITIEIPLGLDSDDFNDGISRIEDGVSKDDALYHNTATAARDSYVSTDNALHAARQQEAAAATTHHQHPAKLELAGSTTTSKHTLPDTRSGHPTTMREQNVLVIHSFRTSISARKIANDAEAVLEFPATALNQAKEILARAIDRRRIRLGRYSATKDQTAFKGVASVKTCLGSTPNAPCIETATKGILVGSWTLDELRSRHEAQRFNFTNSFTSGLYRSADEDGKKDGTPFPEMAYVGGGRHHSMTSSTVPDISSPRGWMPFLCTLLHHGVSAVVVIGIITSLSVAAHQQQQQQQSRIAQQGFGGYSRGGAPPPPPPPLVHPLGETLGIAVGVFVAFIVLSYISTTFWILACLGVWATVWTTRLMTLNQIFLGILLHSALYLLM